MTKEQFAKVVQAKMDRLAATAKTAAEFAAKAATLNKWAAFQAAYVTQET